MLHDAGVQRFLGSRAQEASFQQTLKAPTSRPLTREGLGLLERGTGTGQTGRAPSLPQRQGQMFCLSGRRHLGQRPKVSTL
jgi:hypothetical protein